MDEQAAAIHVPQKIVAQPNAVGRSFNKPGDVRHDKPGAVIQIHHTQMRIQGGKMVVGDLRPGIADSG